MKQNFKYIGFDADDTLWVNEPYYQETEKKFCVLLAEYLPADHVSAELLKTEISNLELYGFGAKGFMLSLIETAIRISGGRVSINTIDKIISLGKELLNKPVELLDGVTDVLNYFSTNGTKLIVATKGDLLDQERKLKKSNLEHYFHHIEIMSDKKESDYLKLLAHLEIQPLEFLMIGNSIKSDILPVLNIGGNAVHVPYHTTWALEQINKIEKQANFLELDHISDIIKIFES
jgi:putative hydrolase of the HAD superfamily